MNVGSFIAIHSVVYKDLNGKRQEAAPGTKFTPGDWTEEEAERLLAEGAVRRVDDEPRVSHEERKFMPDETPLSRARASLERMQAFDTSTLKRVALGIHFDFLAAIPHADRLVSIFKKVPLDSLDEFPDQQLSQIQGQADAVFDLFEQVLNFDATRSDAIIIRRNIIRNIENSYQSVFSQLVPFISYGVARTVDFQRLETDRRAVFQGIKGQANSALEEIKASRAEASDVLAEVKRTAAEQGVSQQATYFAEEAKHHATESDKWSVRTRNWAVALVAYGVGSFFLHKIPWIMPSGTPEAISLVASKVLIFAVLSYMLILAARNFLSHKHNAVVNKHRQNALMTFNALVEAGRGQGTQDIVLSHAASCIFSPQDTGYTRHGGNPGQSPNVADLIPRTTTVRMDGG